MTRALARTRCARRLTFFFPAFVACAAAPTLTHADEEFRAIDWSWTIYAGDFGSYDSPEAALAAWNQRQEERYATEAARNCGQAHKIIYQLDSRLSPLASLVNGQYTFRSTDAGTATSYTAECWIPGRSTPIPASGPYVVSANAGIGVAGSILCPTGWSMRWVGQEPVVIDGRQITPNEVACVRNIPEPAACGANGDGAPAPDRGGFLSRLIGNPIDVVGESKVMREVDYLSPTDEMLSVRRDYSSAAGQWYLSHQSSLTELASRTGGAGLGPSVLVATLKRVPPGYYESPNERIAVDTPRSFPLVRNPASPDTRQTVVMLPGGGRLRFVETGANTFTALGTRTGPELVTYVHSNGQTGTWVRLQEGVYRIYGADGEALAVTRSDGRTIAFERTPWSMKVRAVGSNRELLFSRSSEAVPAGLYDLVTLPDGTSVQYSINDLRLITGVLYPDGSRKAYLHRESHLIAGVSSSLPNHLTGLVDELGTRVGTYSYDSGGPVATELAGGLGKYQVSGYSGYASVTPPTPGAAHTIRWETGPDGQRRITSATQPAGSGCSASSSSLSYDAGGNVASRNDFNGKRICYANDLTRNLESVRVEGLAGNVSCSTVTGAGASLPLGARKVSSEWHPHWRFATRLAEPGRITTYVYNGQPDPFNGGAVASCAPAGALLPDGKPIAVLCRQVEQATTDANGSQGFSAALQAGVANREQRWTYNQYGQVLTHDGPRTDVSDITTYTYYSDTSFTGTGSAAVGHTIGDLQSITNAAGQVTQYTQYDKHGQLLQSVDPNGVVTSHTYDLRQRLLSTTVGGQTTSYTYDLAGQLKRVTQPDGSWIGFDYDPAHRQTAAYDNLGNRIEYLLDNAGNRTGESVKDSTGALRRQLARSIDALGRVQQTTGRE